jgi:hypothetical protein
MACKLRENLMAGADLYYFEFSSDSNDPSSIAYNAKRKRDLSFYEEYTPPPPPPPPPPISLIQTPIKHKSSLNNGKNLLFFDEQSIQFMRLIHRRRYDINCEAILDLNAIEIKKASTVLKESLSRAKAKKLGVRFSESKIDQVFIFGQRFCETFKMAGGYNDYTIRQAEYDFPLAYTIFAYENAEQFERLLKLIYRPHNVYCIHVDLKSTPVFRVAIRSIAQCFDNIIFASTTYSINNNSPFNHLKANMVCMKDLLESKKTNWKYLINLAGYELPLRTNYELTRILKIYNGANDIRLALTCDLDVVSFHFQYFLQLPRRVPKWRIRLHMGHEKLDAK